jgi:hypothetical protein
VQRVSGILTPSSRSEFIGRNLAYLLYITEPCSKVFYLEAACTENLVSEQERNYSKRTKRRDSYQERASGMEIDSDQDSGQIDSDRARRYKIRQLYRKDQE